jgi:hypothetical protein
MRVPLALLLAVIVKRGVTVVTKVRLGKILPVLN